MNKKRSEEPVKIEIAEEKSQLQEEDNTESMDEGIKPLEDMTTPELIDKIKELQDKSEKDYDKFLRAQAEIDNIIKRNKKRK